MLIENRILNDDIILEVIKYCDLPIIEKLYKSDKHNFDLCRTYKNTIAKSVLVNNYFDVSYLKHKNYSKELYKLLQISKDLNEDSLVDYFNQTLNETLKLLDEDNLNINLMKKYIQQYHFFSNFQLYNNVLLLERIGQYPESTMNIILDLEPNDILFVDNQYCKLSFEIIENFFKDEDQLYSYSQNFIHKLKEIFKQKNKLHPNIYKNRIKYVKIIIEHLGL